MATQRLRTSALLLAVVASPAVAHELVLDATVYAPDTPAPAFLYSNEDIFLVPRASLFLDAAIGDRVSVHGQVRVDRGFDPRADDDVDARFDEYFADVAVMERGRFALRIGKFATPFGTWVARHLVDDNPLISAPLLYEDALPVSDDAAPASTAAFARRRDLPDNKGDWVAIVWGPSYTTGAAVFAGTETLDFALEVKNASLSSRPDTWDVIDDGFATDPTVTARASWRPVMELMFGVSGSSGPWMQDDAGPSLPPGANVDDFEQTTVGADVTYELHRLQVWSELVHATFEVPRVGDVDVTSGYVEASYKLVPQVWLAARWNQSWFDDVPGLDVSWDRDVKRVDLAIGYRHDAHAMLKVEYGVSDQSGADANGDHVFAVQLVYRL